MPAFLQLGFGLKLMAGVIVSVALLAALLGWLGRRSEMKAGATGGTGQVVGIVGRMGSGKTMLAVKIAWNRLAVPGATSAPTSRCTYPTSTGISGPCSRAGISWRTCRTRR